MVSRIRKRITAARCLVLTVVCLAGCNSNPLGGSDFVFFSATDLTVGTGAQVVTGDVVTIDFVGWLYDGDASDNKGQQIDSATGLTFVLGAGQVIPGLEQGMNGMRVGGRRRLTVPASLAFGDLGSSTVPPGAALVLEVVLVDARPLTTDSAPFTIIDLAVGTGAEAVSGDILTVVYAGWLYDESEPENKGLQFEVGPDSGLNFTLGVGQVIPGWDQGIVGMRVGGERRLIIPPELAYGAVRRGLIPPNATILFDIRLVAIS